MTDESVTRHGDPRIVQTGDMTSGPRTGIGGSLATEGYDAERALGRLPEVRSQADLLIRRLGRYVPVTAGDAILDVGAAQGLYVAALCEAGYAAIGAEPWGEARRVSELIGERISRPLTIVDGTAETLPFADEEFALVLATSVMEHTTDPVRAAVEAHRVLRPGGGFYFWTTSVLCPRQSEIKRFPAFPWYPDRTKKRLMTWAATSRPALIGYTTRPALHWFSPWSVRRMARTAGFSAVYERWDLHRVSELGPARGRALGVIRKHGALRHAADMFIEGSSYLFVK
jgi:SAM-dependent methyltransferase